MPRAARRERRPRTGVREGAGGRRGQGLQGPHLLHVHLSRLLLVLLSRRAAALSVSPGRPPETEPSAPGGGARGAAQAVAGHAWSIPRISPTSTWAFICPIVPVTCPDDTALSGTSAGRGDGSAPPAAARRVWRLQAGGRAAARRADLGGGGGHLHVGLGDLHRSGDPLHLRPARPGVSAPERTRCAGSGGGAARDLALHDHRAVLLLAQPHLPPPTRD